MIKKFLKYYWTNNKRSKDMQYSGYFSRIFLAFFCAFILLTVAILSSHGSALPVSNDFSNLDTTQNIGGDVKDKEENNGSEFVWEYEGGNSIINICLVDVNDANDDTDFDYIFEFVNCTNPRDSDTDGDDISDATEIEKRKDNPSQYNPNIQDSLPPEVKNVKVSMQEHWTTFSQDVGYWYYDLGSLSWKWCTLYTISVPIIEGISVKVTADISDASGVYDVTFKKGSTVVDGLLVSGNTFNAGFWMDINLGSLIKLVTDITVGFTVKVKAYDYLNNWNESEGEYKGPFTVMAEIVVSMLTSAWNTLCAVAEKIKDAALSLLSWMWDVITSMVNAVIFPIVNAINGFVMGFVNQFEENYEKYGLVGAVVGLATYVVTSNLFFALCILTVTLLAIEILVKALSMGSDVVIGLTVVDFLVPIIIMGVIAGARQASEATFGYGWEGAIEDLLEQAFSSIFTGIGISLASAAVATSTFYYHLQLAGGNIGKVFGDLLGMALGVLGLIIIFTTHICQVSGTIMFLADLCGIALTLAGVWFASQSHLDKAFWICKLGDILSFVSVAIGIIKIGVKDYFV